MIVLALAIAGALGAVARFALDSVVRTKLHGAFPWATVAINISGSLLLGFVAGLVLFDGASSDLQTVVGTGFCGGYTTFSTASVETVRLMQQGRRLSALANAVATLVLSVGACAVGVAIAA